jgi:hypothetical protein
MSHLPEGVRIFAGSLGGPFYARWRPSSLVGASVSGPVSEAEFNAALSAFLSEVHSASVATGTLRAVESAISVGGRYTDARSEVGVSGSAE